MLDDGHDVDETRAKESSCYLSRPIGVLTVHINGCRNLRIGDITTSDPFVEIKYLNKIYTTDVIYRDLNPTWNETYFDLILYESFNETGQVELTMTVYDHDFSQAADYLGSIQLKLDRKFLSSILNKKVNYVGKLKDGDEGIILYGLTYSQLSDYGNIFENTPEILNQIPVEGFQTDLISKSKPSIPPIIITERNVYGIIILSNLQLNKLKVLSTQSASVVSPHSFSFSLEIVYQQKKLFTGSERGYDTHEFNISFSGVYPIVMIDNPNKQIIQPNTSEQQNIVIKIISKNKLSVKSQTDILISGFNRLQFGNSKNILKDIREEFVIGNTFSGSLLGKMQFISRSYATVTDDNKSTG